MGKSLVFVECYRGHLIWKKVERHCGFLQMTFILKDEKLKCVCESLRTKNTSYVFVEL